MTAHLVMVWSREDAAELAELADRHERIQGGSMTEWRDIPGYEGLYQVSDDGQVNSLGRVVDKGRWGIAHFAPRILKQSLTAGYPTVDLYRDRKQTQVFVHRLVAQVFLADTYFEGAITLHGDGNRTNNVVTNLRWGTYSDNNRDKTRHGTDHNASKTHCPQKHEYTPENTYIRQDGSRRCRRCTLDQQRRARGVR
jgi:hypothetical protein